jgi:protein-tyrosine-phosphatase
LERRSIREKSARPSLGSRRARWIRAEYCERFDYVLIIDEEDCRAVAALCCWGSAEGFDRVVHLADEASRGLLKVICKRRQHYV